MMNATIIVRGLGFCALGLLLMGSACKPDRGQFGDGSCNDRMDVYPEAKSAVYFDINGLPLGTQAEDLEGTEHNRMCGTPPHPGGPGACQQGFCEVPIGPRKFCLRCS